MTIVNNLFIYPIKSTFRIPLECADVTPTGFQYDRHFAVINSQNKIITARENEKLYTIKSKIEAKQLVLFSESTSPCAITLQPAQMQRNTTVGIFSDTTAVHGMGHKVNVWLSEVLGEPCRLVRTDENNLRQMKPEYNGRPGDGIGFKDAAAIHLISEASVVDLNTHLQTPVSIHHFRPNIVVKGSPAYEEEQWTSLKIGACEFEVAVPTARCKMTTIDPQTQKIHKESEPLRTLAKFKKTKNEVHFGMYLIPRKWGKIREGDKVEVY